MKKYIVPMFLCAVWLFCLLTTSVSAESMSNVTAAIDSSNLVNVSGILSSGAGKLVTVKILSPDGKIEYSGLATSTSGGGFQLTYALTNSAKGKYTVSVGALGVTTPVVCYFTNNADADVKAAINRDHLVTVNGSAIRSGIPVSVMITDPNGKFEYVDYTLSGQDGKYKFTYTMTNTVKGKYHVTVGMTGLKSPLTTDFYYGSGLLSNLTIDKASLNPAFLPGQPTYQANVENYVSSVTITPTVMDPGSSVTVNSKAVNSGTASDGIALNVGTNTISVVVTAQDGNTNTYTIAVTRANAPAPAPAKRKSADANLSGLAISSGTLAPVFSADTTDYTATVENSVNSIMVTPVVEENHATVKVNNEAVASGTTSQAISLNEGANTVTVEVTAQNGAVKTYTISVTRGNTLLSSLELSFGAPLALNPNFNTADDSYTLDVEYVVTSVRVISTVVPTAENAGVDIKIDGDNTGWQPVISNMVDVSLAVGETTISIRVTYGDKIEIYTVKITRASSEQ